MQLQPCDLPHQSEIHIWKVSLLQQEPAAGSLEPVLSREEKRRSAQFHFDHLRRNYILTHGALRVILGSYCGRSPETLHFERGPYGKPFLADPSDILTFNLSHCEDLALIVVAVG